MLRKKEKEHKHVENAAYKINCSICSFLLKIFIFLFLSVSFISNSFSEEPKDKENLNQPIVELATQKISDLEDKIFHQKYTSDKIEDRLSRLEEFIFGTKYASFTISDRLQKLSEALTIKSPKTTITLQKPTPIIEPLNEKQTEEPKVIYDESFNTGVIGTISQIETMVFGKSFNESPFQQRVENLEQKILSNAEITKNKNKNLMERVAYLIKKVGVTPLSNQVETQHYTIDPNTGYLINENTRDIVNDSFGNPIKVNIPPILKQNLINPSYNNQFQQLQQFPQPYGNQFPPAGFPQQVPYDLLFNQGGFDLGEDPNNY